MDGTLTAPRKVVTPEMRQFLADLRKKVTVGVVGGSDLAKAKEQLGEDYLDIVDWYIILMSLPKRRHASPCSASPPARPTPVNSHACGPSWTPPCRQGRWA